MVQSKGATPPPHTLMSVDDQALQKSNRSKIQLSVPCSVKNRLERLSALIGVPSAHIAERAITTWVENHYDQLEAFYSQEVPQS